MSTFEHPRDEQPTSGGWSRICGRFTGLAALIGLVVLPRVVAASPPSPSPFADLPSPEDLPDVLPEPAAEPRKPVEPEVRASPPEDEIEAGADGEGETGEDEAGAGGAGEDEAAPEPRPEPRWTIKKLKKAVWIKHRIVPGERLDEIADRYQVRKGSLIRWNKLDPDKPKIYAGRELAVYTKYIPPPQQQLIYTVESGDSWNKIAKAYRVDPEHLRLRWNAKVPRKFKAGQELVIWIDPLDDPDLLRDPDEGRDKGGGTKATAGTSAGASGTEASSSSGSSAVANLPLATIQTGSISVGKPNHGKIVNGIRLPENKQLYTVRKPDESWGSTHTLHNLQLAIANWRHDTGYKGDLVIGAISKQGGGKLKPHSSHQSGRDVDIRLPLKRAGGEAENTSDVDWDATWALIQALVATGEVQYIFLSTSRQKFLHKAAKRAGASKDMIERMIQYPNSSGSNSGIVRHSKGHTAHFHVRFTCAANEARCESY